MPKHKSISTPSSLLPSAKPSRRADLLAPIALLLLALPWWIAATCPFIHMDDGQYVTQNSHVLSGLSLDNIRWAFTNVDVNLYQPVTWLSLLLDASIFGSGPVGFHITNVLLHLANMFLVYAFLRTTTGIVSRSFLVAALFAMHPLRVESVAWVTERKDVLAIFFGLLALCAYARYASTRRLGWYAAVVLLATLSLLSKATLVTLPALLLLLDVWPLKRFAGNARRPWTLLLEKIPFLLLSAAIIAVTSYALRTQHAVIDMASYPLSARIANAILSIMLYLRDTFYPMELALFYPLVHSVPTDQVIFGISLILILSLLALWHAKITHNPAVAIGLFWFLGTLVPALGLIQSGAQSRADRFTYLPSIGLAIALVWLCPIGWLSGPRARVGITLATVALLAIISLTTLQLLLWRDPLALYLDGIAHTQNNSILNARAADALVQSGSFENAELYYRRSLSIDPINGETHNNLGSLLARWHRYPEALTEFRRATELDPWDPVIQSNYHRLLQKHPPDP